MKVDLPTPTFGGGYDGQARPRMGFFTDTSSASGARRARSPARSGTSVPQDGRSRFTGDSYDNTGRARGAAPGATWRSSSRQPRRRTTRGSRWLMCSDVCKHCSTAACLEVCPTGALFRTEFGTVVRPARRLQRLRLLRARLPVRGDRPARGRRPGLEVHALLRPAARRAGAGLRQGLPDRLDPVRRRSTSCATGPSERVATPARGRGRRGPAVPGGRATTASAGPARSSCCWTSPRCTGCRPTRCRPPATCPALWRAAALAAGTLAAAVAASFVGRRR